MASDGSHNDEPVVGVRPTAYQLRMMAVQGAQWAANNAVAATSAHGRRITTGTPSTSRAFKRTYNETELSDNDENSTTRRTSRPFKHNGTHNETGLSDNDENCTTQRTIGSFPPQKVTGPGTVPPGRKRASKADQMECLENVVQNGQKAREKQATADLLRQEAKHCSAGGSTVAHREFPVRMEEIKNAERENDRSLEREKLEVERVKLQPQLQSQAGKTRHRKAMSTTSKSYPGCQ